VQQAQSTFLVRPTALAIFAGFDAKDVSALAAHMTDESACDLGNAETVEGKTANHRNQAMTTRPTGSDSRAARPPETRKPMPHD